MTTLPKNPALYEIDTRAWLHALGRLTLDQIPGQEVEHLKTQGFDWIWMLGVWRLGTFGRTLATTIPELVQAGRAILPDYQDDDLAGSLFAVQGYEVSPDYGGDPALAHWRAALNRQGLRLMLDFVPNHTARDHPWVAAHPEFYVQGHESDLAREPGNYARVDTDLGPRILAFGRDPNFPGWTDTFQLNYRHRAFREAMADELLRVAGRCDGLRCDMAMLLLPEVFLSTWGDCARPVDGTAPDDTPFWPWAIARLRSKYPDFYLLAEAYWDLEWPIQQQGFDATYDKRLYDRLRNLDAQAVRAHLRADPEFQRHCARFLENHDEPRAAAVFPPDVHRASALITFLTPGLRFFHQGQLEGRKVRPSVHLRRRPDDPVDPALTAFYERLLAVLNHPEPRQGRWRLADCRAPWTDNPTWDHFLAFTWEVPGEGRWLVAVNYGPTQAQCFVTLPTWATPPATVRFRDLLSPAIYDRDALDLSTRGLYLDLPAWGYHVFAVEPGR